jgi:hypothetical protein
MHVSDDEMEDTESEVEEDRSLVAAKRFNCDKLYLRCQIVFHFPRATIFDNVKCSLQDTCLAILFNYPWLSIPM